MPGQFPQVLRARVAHGAVEKQDVHSLSVPRHGEYLHLPAEINFLAVELWRGVVKMGPATTPHRVQKQRRHGGLQDGTVSPPMQVADTALNIIGVRIVDPAIQAVTGR